MIETDSDGGHVRALWKELQETQDLDCKELLLERLADAALEMHDFSDPEIPEEIHNQFEELRRSRDNYNLISVRVGRFVARMLDEHEVRSASNARADDPTAN